MADEDRWVRTLEAVLDRLIPSDEHGVGAVEAGVLDYVLARYAGPDGAATELYRAGLDDLDVRAQANGGTRFVDAAPAVQDLVLGEVEREGRSSADSERAATFFETVLRHSREGMFGDPIHGGNRDCAGWDLIRYPDARRVWSAAEQGLDVISIPLLPRWAEPPHSPTHSCPSSTDVVDEAPEREWLR